MSTPYTAATTAAALFDTSASGKLIVSGPDAPGFLSNLSTNDIANLPLGGGGRTYFLDHRAKALFQAIAYHVLLDGNRHAIWLDTVAGYGAKLFAHLDRYLISEAVEPTDVSDQYAQLHLAGPTAAAVLEAALGEPIPPLVEFQHMERTFGAHATASVRRRDPLGLPGFDIVTRTEKADGVRRMLLAAGATAAGDDVFETLRVEAGTPIYGKDIDEARFVMEVGDAAAAVCYTKGCFIGQEPIVMARDRAGHVNRAFLRLRAVAGGPPRPGTKLTRDGAEVGVITSSTDSPRLGPIALGYVKRGHQDPGLRLDADGQTVEVLPPERSVK